MPFGYLAGQLVMPAHDQSNEGLFEQLPEQGMLMQECPARPLWQERP